MSHPSPPQGSTFFQSFQTQRATLVCAGPIGHTMAAEFELMMSIAREDYHYDDLTLEMNSPGGQIDHLRQMLRVIAHAKSNGVRVRTHALTQASSAAAILLAMGSYGSRWVSPEATVVFHHSRLNTSQHTPITADLANTMQEQTKQCDQWVIKNLLESQIQQLGGQENLVNVVSTRAADILAEYERISAQLYVVVPTKGAVDRQKRTLRTLAALSTKASNEALNGYKKQLKIEFDRDRPIELTLAYAMALVDGIDGIDISRGALSELDAPSVCERADDQPEGEVSRPSCH
jgi:ATP-dependent protease ClpP protease subunit